MNSERPTVIQADNASSGLTNARIDRDLGDNSFAMNGIFVLLCIFAAYIAAPVLKPIAIALLLSLIFVPVVRMFVRCYVPLPLAAAVVVVGIMLVAAGAVYSLAEPASQWFEKGSTVLQDVERKLRPLKENIELLQEAEKKISELADVGPPAPAPPPERKVGLIRLMLSAAPQTLASVIAIFVLLFFLLASGDEFLRKLARVGRSYGDKKKAVKVALGVQRQLSRYLSVITAINFALGMVSAAVLHWMGVPNPLLWGAMVALFNYVPYLGAIASVLVLAVVGLLSFDSPLQIFAPAVVIGVLQGLEGQFVTPVLAGRALLLSPVAIFIFLFLMGWAWGIVGILVSIPLLASFRLVCEDVESLRSFAVFLGK